MNVNEYEVLEKIGEGSYGSCHKVRRKKDKKIFVWKRIFYGDMSEMEKQFIINEVNLLRDLRHPNIVEYVDHVIIKRESAIFLVMEYCSGGDLSQCIKKWRREKRNPDEEFVWKVFSQICQALSVCHLNQSRNGSLILHRDIKPANIFLDDNMNAKLGDFGLAKVIDSGRMANTFVGTPYYMSPEQLFRQSYDEKSDIWSLGCLTYEMCSLYPPFMAHNQAQLGEIVKKGVFKRIPICYSTKLQSAIEKMLKTSKFHRPSAADLLHISELKKFLPKSSVCDLKQWEKQLKDKEEHLFRKEKEIAEKEKSLEKLKLEIEKSAAKTRGYPKRSECRDTPCSVCGAAKQSSILSNVPTKKHRLNLSGHANDILQRSPRLRAILAARKSASPH